MRRIALPTILAAAMLAACATKPSADAAAAQPADQAPAAAQAGSPPPADAAPQAGSSPVQIVTGPVLETMNAASYTYVRVKTEGGDVWAASSQFPVAVGDRVVVPLETPMQNFRSPSLNREFAVIYFASRITREGEAAPAVAPAMMSSHGPAGEPQMPAGHAAVTAAPVVTKVDPPAGGLRVVEVWDQRTQLAGKTVTVRGTVVKFNGGILGRNWIHIQDGSGKAADGTHDLTVTSDAAAKVGDVITVTGTVAVDRDFTAGYAYPVIVEGAKIVK